MAAVHAGYINQNCHVCHDKAIVRAVNGCDTVLEAPVETIPLNEKLYEYYNCPIQFIPDSLNSFFSLYQFGIDFGGIVYKEVANRFIEACQFYKARLNHFRSVKNG
jgi:hypothetical protein